MKPQKSEKLKFKKGEKVWMLENMETHWRVVLMKIIQAKQGRGTETRNRYRMVGFGAYAFVMEKHLFHHNNKKAALEKASELTEVK